MKSVMVVAFDGLDKELIERFGLETIQQTEFGDIENFEGFDKIKTSILFSSFITGSMPEKHGIEEVRVKTGSDFLHKFEDSLGNKFLLDKFSSLRKDLYESIDKIDYGYRWPQKEDIEEPTLFEKIENSKSMFVPAYNTSKFFMFGHETDTISKITGDSSLSLTIEDVSKYYDNREFRYRREKLFRPVNKWLDFSMIHFHRVDMMQHFFADPRISGEKNFDRLEEIYTDIDDLAKDIIDYFEDEYDYIVFMSDHGLPANEVDKGHNENAFYSCNKELFGEETPHITDFHDKILELTGNEDKIDSS